MITPQEVLELIEKYPDGYSPILRFKHKDLIIYLKENFPASSTGESLYKWIYPDKKNTCKLCKNPTNFKQFSHGYFEFCSYSCRAKHNESYKNAHDENGKLKGYDKLMLQIPTIMKKAQETCLAKYGLTTQQLSSKRITQKKIDNLPEELKTLESIKQLDQTTVRTNFNYEQLKFAYKQHGLKVPKLITGRSKQEDDFASYLDTLQISYSQSNKILSGRREIDFLINGNLGIEYCGLFWHSDRNGYDKQKHFNKFKDCKEQGLKLITIFEDEWLFKKDIVKSRIRNLVKLNTEKLYARKCTVQVCPADKVKQFLNLTHLSGAKNSKNNICLVLNNEIVACLTYGAARYCKESTEIIRYATRLNTNVVGGFSRLVKKLRTKVTGKIISYSDNRWGDGSMYAQCGFTFDSLTPPSYYYFKIQEKQRFHRSAFMKHFIVQKMGADKDLTEVENMRNFGYNRIFDCGTSKWILN